MTFTQVGYAVQNDTDQTPRYRIMQAADGRVVQVEYNTQDVQSAAAAAYTDAYGATAPAASLKDTEDALATAMIEILTLKGLL